MDLPQFRVLVRFNNFYIVIRILISLR
jgi:hypothetical protein